MTAPWLDDGDIALYHGSALDVLRSLPAGIAQTCVTSPPYWGLRDYGTGSWTGGDPGCDHATGKSARNDGNRNGADGFAGSRNAEGHADMGSVLYKDECARCGARRVDDQLGLEATPTEYVERLVAVMREVWRVLRADGTLWLNLGDSYVSNGFWPDAPSSSEPSKSRSHAGGGRAGGITGAPGLKTKDLVGIPWRVAFALQADGWYLRSDIIWAKPNPMPESVTDRPTKAHEYVFLLAKQPRYYYDADAIREPHGADSLRASKAGHGGAGYDNWEDRGGFRGVGALGRGSEHRLADAGRNARSVWEVATQPTPEAHFATYPEALVRRCILAGTSEAGECSVCGAPWVREVERAQPPQVAPSEIDRYGTGDAGVHRKVGGQYQKWLDANPARTTGWSASCQCGAPSVPQLVLDPFVGSGTTALVARKHGRRAIGIDLSEEYLAIAARRTAQLSLLGDGSLVRGGGAA